MQRLRGQKITLEDKRFVRELLSILIPEYDQTHPSNQTFKVKSKKKVFQALILMRKPK